MTIPVCGFSYGGETCDQVGAHRCELRGHRVVDFFSDVLVHPKGIMSGQPFELRDWQEDEIVRPLFETVNYSTFSKAYARTFRIAWIELARKSGKSTLVAGLVIYLLVADGEQNGENYIGARDRNQAAIIFNTASQMVEASHVLSERCTVLKAGKRIVHKDSNSFLQVISSDAMSALGFSPHGAALDEIVAHQNGDLWDSMTTATGARKQPLIIAATTAGTNVESFAGNMHKEMQKIQDEPERSPHTFVYMRNTPMAADPWDETNWYHANPGLGEYLDITELRNQALEAQNDPSREVAFRTYRLNQWTQISSRWMNMTKYDAAQGELWPNPKYGRAGLQGRVAFAGLDLASTSDLTSWCIAVLPTVDDPVLHLLWRFWLPEDGVRVLDDKLDGQVSKWVSEGWIATNDGNIVDYEQVYTDIAQDIADFDLREIDYDSWSAAPAVQAIEGLASKQVQMVKIQQTFASMSPNMAALMTNVDGLKVQHHGNPVARFCFDSVEVRFDRTNPDNVLPQKPARNATSKRIDGVIAAAMAIGAYTLRGAEALKPAAPKGRSKGTRSFAW